MGLTLIAILTAALLLPGIMAAWAFFQAAQTNEVESSVPSLSTPEGLGVGDRRADPAAQGAPDHPVLGS